MVLIVKFPLNFLDFSNVGIFAWFSAKTKILIARRDLFNTTLTIELISALSVELVPQSVNFTFWLETFCLQKCRVQNNETAYTYYIIQQTFISMLYIG